ncbi:NAD(P)H-binding protein [Pseudarthrobacter sulfonivorans]|uniref:SDR family oxidoreductase n=1 Tax=Pseudarthrobacter sulfonivorans TaxID=121292 RepID=UPI00285A14F4|nr:NAD(P)H-binding protein [Pseudarthrobacter sulfonivorans]MDR6416567.1 NADH dehydrogenase [Pseudarthrobacter sulfonivorans]
MILLAGGTGTLGGVLVQALQAARMPFRILTRSSHRAAPLREAGLDVAIGDAGNPADVTRALSGCTAVVSAISGFGPQSGSTPPAVDRDGNINLMEAAERGGVRQFIHFSMHGASASHPMELARMKYAAEQRLMAGSLAWTIMRPTTILETYAAIMGESLRKSGVAVVFGRGDKPVNFVSAVDLAGAVVLALRGGLKNQAVDVGGPDNMPLNELAGLLIERNGRGRTVHVPLPLLRAAAAGARWVAPPWGRVLGGAVNLGAADMSFDAAPERTRLPGVPYTPVREALALLDRSA